MHRVLNGTRTAEHVVIRIRIEAFIEIVDHAWQMVHYVVSTGRFFFERVIHTAYKLITTTSSRRPANLVLLS